MTPWRWPPSWAPDGRPAAWAQRACRRRLPVRDGVDVGAGRPVRLMAFRPDPGGVTLALIALGLVMVYSASVALPDNPKFANYSQTFFLQRHLLSLAMAFVRAGGGAGARGLLGAPRPVIFVARWCCWCWC
jgi:hypothetical protein